MTTQPPQSGNVLILDESNRFAIAQAVYNAATGKTERLTRNYPDSYVVTLEDLAQLHAKCVQACAQWNVLNKSTAVTVHHSETGKAQFSSFERFKLYDKSQTTPVESVAYEFNMLMALPGQDAPQHYKLTVRIMSRVAMLQRMKNNLPPPSFLRFFTGEAIVAEVDYVDYVVARNILTIVDSWAKETERPVKWKRAKRLQGISRYIPPLFHILFGTLTALALFAATKTIITPQSTPAELGQWLIVAFAAFIIGGQLALQLGRSVERSIDSIFELSAELRYSHRDE